MSFDKYVAPIVLDERDIQYLREDVVPMQLAIGLDALRDAIMAELPRSYPQGLPKGAQFILRGTVLLEGETLK